MTISDDRTMTTNHTVQLILHSLARMIPTYFTGDWVQAQQFLNEFRQLDQVNQHHLLVTQPKLQVELVLTFIQGPRTDPWQCTLRRGQAGKLPDESIWDEFFNLFCTTWINGPPTPVTQMSPPMPANDKTTDCTSLDLDKGELLSSPVQIVPPPLPVAEDDNTLMRGVKTSLSPLIFNLIVNDVNAKNIVSSANSQDTELPPAPEIQDIHAPSNVLISDPRALSSSYGHADNGLL
ncbi:hypothetical protein EDB83DRAFT_2528878 [Lactarius deliciosus]|nr:hypothetical protein EDB83DRAFT_2528878 [Lactarius deliciosus]